MLKAIIVTGASIAALMAGIKDHALQTAGLTGSCVVAQRYVDGSQLTACRAGKLEGRPDLSRQGCIAAGVSGTYEYWRCPAALTSGP